MSGATNLPCAPYAHGFAIVQTFLRRVLTGLLSVHAALSYAATPDKNAAYEDQGARFVQQFCIDCHSKETEEGERNFDTFSLPIKTVSRLEIQ